MFSPAARAIRHLLTGHAPLLRRIRAWRSEALSREVDVDIYLPPDYRYFPTRRYPLIVFNDGQDLHVMPFSEILKEFYQNHPNAPYVIVAGVYAGHERMREYGVTRQADYKGRGDKAVQYSAFILTELLPLLRRRFRLITEKDAIAVAGFSLGGLSAMDLAWGNPEIFGCAGVFSGSFWWRSAPVSAERPDDGRIIHDIIQETRLTEEHRQQHFWFQCGTQDETEDRNNNGIIDAIDDTLDLIKLLQEKGMPNEAIQYLEIEGGEHNPTTWAEAMPDFLHFFLKTIAEKQ